MNKNTKAKHTNPNDITILNSNENNVYCYTFACPNNFYKVDNTYERESKAILTKKIHMDYTNPHSVRYRCIFNIVNDDDFVPKLPMEECKWTKYGRVAKLSIASFHREKMYQQTINYIEGKQVYDDVKRTAKSKFLYNYIGDSYYSDKIVEDMNGIFPNKKNMRNDTYTLNDNDVAVIQSGVSISHVEQNVTQYSLPYQTMYYNKNDINSQNSNYDIYKGAVIQKQMPAYLFQTIAGGMHVENRDGDNAPMLNKVSMTQTQTAERFTKGKTTIILNSSFIEHPHYLESYYILTEKIKPIDFK